MPPGRAVPGLTGGSAGADRGLCRAPHRTPRPQVENASCVLKPQPSHQSAATVALFCWFFGVFFLS